MRRSGRSQLRIIAGKWRGRKLEFPELSDLRPTPDRVRETLFNWLQADVPGSLCLDLFAGSGALGFEAASRGASRVIMVDDDRTATSALAANAVKLKADNVEIVTADALGWLNSEDSVFDLAFLDPPYHASILGQCCALLEHGKNLAENAKIYLEHSRVDTEVDVPENWVCLKSRLAGQVAYKLFGRAQQLCQ